MAFKNVRLCWLQETKTSQHPSLDNLWRVQVIIGRENVETINIRRIQHLGGFPDGFTQQKVHIPTEIEHEKVKVSLKEGVGIDVDVLGTKYS